MLNKMWENEFRTTVVCIDTYQNSVPTGRLFNPALAGGRQFNSLMEFFHETEKLLDSLRFPQSFSAARSFRPSPEPSGSAGPPGPEFRKGKLATFYIRIIFRQNASWQGSVTWLEGEREESFRSALELVLLMDSVLSEAN